MNEDEARAYLHSLSNHPERPGDVSNMYGDFAIRLANTLKQANDQGMGLRLESGYRDPNELVSQGRTGPAAAFDAAGNSTHTYGIGADIDGLGSAGSVQAQNFAKIAAANQLYNPYGINNSTEFNHWQYVEQPLNRTPQLLKQLQDAKATGNQQNVFAVLAKAGGGQTPGGNDPRQLVFDMLTSPDVGLTKEQALGAIWSLAGESGPGLNPKATNPNDPGTAFGLGQWIKDRKANLMAYAQANNLQPTDPRAQVGFLKQELLGPEREALIAVKGASTSADATGAWTRVFERPLVDNSAARVAAGPKSATLDANGNLVLTGGASGGTPSTGTPATTTPAGAPAPPTPPSYPGVMSPQQQMYSSIAQSLGSMSSGGGGSGIRDLPDQPPIRTLAMDMPAPQTSVGSQLAQLGSMGMKGTLPDPNASITAGAPSMTGMLDQLGTPSTYNMFDPRATQSPATMMRSPRLGS